MGIGKHLGAAIIVLALGCGCASAVADGSAASEQPAGFEQAAQQHLPGTWKFQYSSAEPAFSIEGTSAYASNGTARYEGTLVVQGRTIPLAFAATWNVRGNKMVTVVTESSAPEAVPVGTVSTDTIHELTPTVFRYTDDEEGMTVTETRVGPEE
jgi:hypothetical protein